MSHSVREKGPFSLLETTRNLYDKAKYASRTEREMNVRLALQFLSVWRKKLPILPIFAVEFFIGVGLILIHNALQITWDFGILHDFGIALLIASLLGATIDVWLTKAFAKDVFEAALGYILPSPFREEARRVIGYKWICERHSLIVILERVDDETVRATMMTQRTIKNITSEPQTLGNDLHIDEWGFKQGNCEILECRIELDSGETKTSGQPIRDASTVRAKTDMLTVQPDHSATLHSKWTEYKRANDAFHVSYMAPTKDPEIEVRIPSDMDYFSALVRLTIKLRHTVIRLGTH